MHFKFEFGQSFLHTEGEEEVGGTLGCYYSLEL